MLGFAPPPPVPVPVPLLGLPSAAGFARALGGRKMGIGCVPAGPLAE